MKTVQYGLSFVFTTFLVIIVFSCKKESNDKVPEVQNIKWRLEYITSKSTNQKTSFPATEQNVITVMFSDSLNTLLFKGVCNMGTGKYYISEKSRKLTVSDLKVTLIACANVIWESYTTSGLSGAQTYDLKGDSLTIFSNSAYNLHFSKR